MIDRLISSQDVSHSSRLTYARQLRQFHSWLVETGKKEVPGNLKREDIFAYKEMLISRGKSPFTIDGYLVAVRKLFEFLEANKICPNIAKGIRGMKKGRGFKKDCLIPSQIRGALESIDRRKPEGLRDFALFNLLSRTGLRTVEISRATIGDLRQQAGETVLWVQGKARDSKDDFVLLVGKTLKPLRKYLASRGPLAGDAPLFASLSDRNSGDPLSTKSIRRIIKNILKGIGLNDRKFSAHSLRHSAITLSIRGGASLQQVQAMARHSDPQITLGYFHNLDRIKSGAERFIRF